MPPPPTDPAVRARAGSSSAPAIRRSVSWSAGTGGSGPSSPNAAASSRSASGRAPGPSAATEPAPVGRTPGPGPAPGTCRRRAPRRAHRPASPQAGDTCRTASRLGWRGARRSRRACARSPVAPIARPRGRHPPGLQLDGRDLRTDQQELPSGASPGRSGSKRPEIQVDVSGRRQHAGCPATGREGRGRNRLVTAEMPPEAGCGS